MNVRLNWTLPTARTDDSPVDVSDISHVEIAKRVVGAPTYTVINEVSPDTLTLLDQDVPPGEYEYRARPFPVVGEPGAPFFGSVLLVAALNPLGEFTVELEP